MKKGYTHISVVLDRSGSMAKCLADTIGGFNTFLTAQKKLEGEATITMVKFDDQYDVMCNMVAIKDAEELSDKNYEPRGWTALLDAIGRTINSVEHDLSEKDEAEKPEKVIFVIITDGEENQSREFTRDQIMEMINRHRNEMNWEFVFIGANQDAIQAGSSMGIRAGNSYTYQASSLGTQAMYTSLTRGMSSYRSKGVEEVNGAEYAFFSADDRKAQEDLVLNNDAKKDEFLKNPKGPLQNIYVRSDTDTK